jgi:hypothetical protein
MEEKKVEKQLTSLEKLQQKLVIKKKTLDEIRNMYNQTLGQISMLEALIAEEKKPAPNPEKNEK